ncbi:Nif3-like dinuclear metal center hexameric protein [Texcoconibacillus texcoconensis]|uniref:Nif3-like dinuclear metal center hexameric protein n=1 Tax=Texcoconibacillus texcoconensis TaxID=1095777 RepID=UPI001621A57F
MVKAVNGQRLIEKFESWSPKSLAVEGDNVGLQIGTLNKPIKKVLVTLDVLEDVVDEAIEQEVDMIIAHHPILFKPLKTLDVSTPYGRMVEKLIKHDVTVYAAHTNLDIAQGGVNDLMAEALGLANTEVLVETTTDPLKKLVVFVPEEQAAEVREAIGNAGAGFIGDYSHCTFNTQGTGTFKPGDATNPFIGEQGEMTFVSEVKLESVFPASKQKQVLKAMEKAHPYEEVAYDVYAMDQPGETKGLGRIGKLAAEETLEAFVERVKAAFSVDHLRVVGDLQRPIRKVAVLGGTGNKYMRHAIRKGADVYVTGDVDYHIAHDAQMDGLAIADPGHNVEKVMKEGVKKKIEAQLQEEGYNGTAVIVSTVHTDPFTFV